MRLGRTEQWLLLGVLLAASGWVGVFVYARLTARAGQAAPTLLERTPAAARDGGEAVSEPPSEMVFSLDEIGVTGMRSEGARRVLVTSVPLGARVLDMGEVVARTPTSFPRPNGGGGDKHLLVQKTGYRSARVVITAESPDRIQVTLRPQQGVSTGSR